MTRLPEGPTLLNAKHEVPWVEACGQPKSGQVVEKQTDGTRSHAVQRQWRGTVESGRGLGASGPAGMQGDSDRVPSSRRLSLPTTAPVPTTMTQISLNSSPSLVCPPSRAPEYHLLPVMAVVPACDRFPNGTGPKSSHELAAACAAYTASSAATRAQYHGAYKSKKHEYA